MVSGITGSWQRDSRSDSRSPAAVSGEGVERRAAFGYQITTMLRTFAGAGAHRAQIVVTIGRWQNESHATFGNTAGARQAVGRNSGICIEIR